MQNAFRTAGTHGHLDIIEWLMDKYDFSDIPIIDVVIQNGHFHVVKWLIEKDDWAEEFEKDDWIIEAMNIAAIYGKIEMLPYLLSHKSNQDSNMHILDGGVSSGKLEIVEWLEDHGCVSEEDLVSRAAETGNIEMLKWVHEHCNVKRVSTDAMDFAAEYSLNIVKFLHEHRPEGCTSQAMDIAAAFGHLDIVRFLHENRSEGCTVKAMSQAASNGHLEIVKFLLRHRSEGVPARAMKAAASSGQLKVVRWLTENGSINPDGVNTAYRAVLEMATLMSWLT